MRWWALKTYPSRDAVWYCPPCAFRLGYRQRPPEAWGLPPKGTLCARCGRRYPDSGGQPGM